MLPKVASGDRTQQPSRQPVGDSNTARIDDHTITAVPNQAEVDGLKVAWGFIMLAVGVATILSPLTIEIHDLKSGEQPSESEMFIYATFVVLGLAVAACGIATVVQAFPQNRLADVPDSTESDMEAGGSPSEIREVDDERTPLLSGPVDIPNRNSANFGSWQSERLGNDNDNL